MTSASSSSARSLFAESKQRLAERVQVNMNNISSLARQIQRGSKSNEVNKQNYLEITITLHLFSSRRVDRNIVEILYTFQCVIYYLLLMNPL